MLNADVFEKGRESIFVRFTCVFLSTIRVEELEFLVGLSFDHGEPSFEEGEYSVGSLVRKKINPRVACSFVSES